MEGLARYGDARSLGVVKDGSFTAGVMLMTNISPITYAHDLNFWEGTAASKGLKWVKGFL
jgi:hypothetical protein